MENAEQAKTETKDFYTQTDVAEIIVTSPRTIRVVAEDIGITPLAVGHCNLYTPDDLARIRAAFAVRYPNHNFRDKMPQGVRPKNRPPSPTSYESIES